MSLKGETVTSLAAKSTWYPTSISLFSIQNSTLSFGPMTRTNPLWPKHSQLPMVHQYIWPRTTCYPKTTTRRYKAIKKLLLKGLGHILNHNLSTHKNILAIFRSLFPNLKLVGALLLPYTATTTCQLKKPRSHPLSVKPIAFYARHSILMVLQLHSP